MLRKLMRRYGKPEALVTDRFPSYKAALVIWIVTFCKHAAFWLNNRVVNTHLPFRRRERAMQRFRCMRSLQKFAAVYSSDHNHINHERGLSSRDFFKQNRTAALDE